MARLTRQELAVLRLAARGMTNRDIGHQLGLQASTVAGHLHEAYKKLGVGNRVQAILAALRKGVLTQEDLTK